MRAKAVLEETNSTGEFQLPSFLTGKRIGMVNMGEEAVRQWNSGEGKAAAAVAVRFERVSEMFKWEDLFPEWIDEEEESEVPTCPEIPMPEFEKYPPVDAVAAKIPCGGGGRDVARLQVHLVAAAMAAKRGKRGVKVAVLSECRPMMEIFRCGDLVAREGDWWVFQPRVSRLLQKLALPIGSCQLALPIWGQGTLLCHRLFFLVG